MVNARYLLLSMRVKDLIARLRELDPELPVVYADDAGTILDLNTSHKVQIKPKVYSYSGAPEYVLTEPRRQPDLFTQEDDGFKALLLG